MKVFVLAIFLLLITGCATTVPVTQTFPSAPPILLEECPPLQQLSYDAKLSDFATTVIRNYMLHHECAIRHRAWTEWYKEQKANFERLSK